MAAGLAFKVAKGVVVKGFWLSLLPLTETVRLSRKRPISQPFFMGSIDQWNKDVTLPITDDGEVVAEVSFDLNRSAIATTGGIAGVGYMVSTAIFASRFQGHTRAKIANALVQKINLNVAIIQRIMDEGKTAHRVSLTAVEPIEIQIRMMQYQRYATDGRQYPTLEIC